jgi:pyridoxal phosphate-dependent aminotransferase EpsN
LVQNLKKVIVVVLTCNIDCPYQKYKTITILAKFRIWLSPPDLGPVAQDYVQQAMQSGWITSLGPDLSDFENRMAAYTGSAKALGLNSGTSAIHLGLKVLGVGPGDAVFCPSLTFAGTINPVLYLGATPVLVDSEPESWNMAPHLLELALEKASRLGLKPKVIMPVHIYGMPANMDAILKIAQKHHLPVLEDAAEALGGNWHGKHLGGIGDLGIFSFNGNKIITTSGGGMLVSKEASQIAYARKLSTVAREPFPWYQHTEVGYNYRLSNILAAIGRAEFITLPAKVAKRRQIYEWYRQGLSEIPGIHFQPEKKGSFSNRWLSAFILPPDSTKKPMDIIEALAKEGIEARPIWKPMHLQPVYRHLPYVAGEGYSDFIFQNGLCLPSGSAMTPEDVNEVCTIIKKLLVSQALTWY